MTDNTFRYHLPSSAGTTWSLGELLRAASGPIVAKITRQSTADRSQTRGGRTRIAGRRQQMLAEINDAYETLRNDPQAWREFSAELAEWDQTLLDGLEEE
jgi:hypothetical protein